MTNIDLNQPRDQWIDVDPADIDLLTKFIRQSIPEKNKFFMPVIFIRMNNVWRTILSYTWSESSYNISMTLPDVSVIRVVVIHASLRKWRWKMYS